MCGICGAIQRETPVDPTILAAMNAMLTHRGPDGEGYDLHEGVGLAMRRLAIIDVDGSQQPLYNETQSLVVVFNGEIFNYQALRQQLVAQGHQFRTDGDGEVLAHLYEQYGDDFPCHLRGQFAIALWDREQQRLLLVRDRYGQKPLYYYHDRQHLLFASEIKAVLQHPAVNAQSIFDDPYQLALYLSYGYVPAPQTAFKGIHALMPAEMLIYHDGTLTTRRYWQPPTISDQRAALRSIDSAIEQVQNSLSEAVRLRLLADVPLGAFLSGGLDSSLIVALMQQLSNRQVKTFSIGFVGDASFDESPYAQQAAQYLETDHTAFTVDPQALSLLEKLVWHHDQPFADSSAIPTYLVSHLTRQHVTVALSGDGGDEQFAGYERFYAATLLQTLQRVPKPLWNVVATLIGWLPEGTGYYNHVKRAGRFVRAARLPLAHAYFDWVRIADQQRLRQLTRLTDDEAAEHFAAQLSRPTLGGILEANQVTYLPDDLLIKADRCSMAASLEVRAPFLDHRLAEMVAPLPINSKLHGTTTKYILKEAARPYLPNAIIDRQKHGFGVPLGAWLRADSRAVQAILLDSAAQSRHIIDPNAVAQLIQQHQSGQRDHNRLLWALLTLEQWHRTFIAS